jgi:hypothetical protein
MKTSTTATTPVLVKLPSGSAVTVVVVIQKQRLVFSNRYRESGFVTPYYIHLMIEAQPPLKSCNTLDKEHRKEKQEMNTKCWLENLLETIFSNRQFHVELENLTFQCVHFHSCTCSLLASNLGNINLKYNNKMKFILWVSMMYSFTSGLIPES